MLLMYRLYKHINMYTVDTIIEHFNRETSCKCNISLLGYFKF